MRDAAVDVEEDFRWEAEEATHEYFVVGGLLEKLGR